MIEMKLLIVAFAGIAALAVGNPLFKSNNDERIVGGDRYEIKDVPYQVSVQHYGFHICGGSILSNKFVLTAAHCTDTAQPYSISVRYGSTSKGVGGNTVAVRKVHQNGNWSMDHMDYDVSILEVDGEIILSENAQPIELSDNEPVEDEELFVSGWGRVAEDEWYANKLRGVNVKKFTNKYCQDSYNFTGLTITPRMLCAGHKDGQKDACLGDSGGPLVSTIGEKKQVGIVSWGVGCARPDRPGVYTSVAAVKEFIERKINK